MRIFILSGLLACGGDSLFMLPLPRFTRRYVYILYRERKQYPLHKQEVNGLFLDHFENKTMQLRLIKAQMRRLNRNSVGVSLSFIHDNIL